MEEFNPYFHKFRKHEQYVNKFSNKAVFNFNSLERQRIIMSILLATREFNGAELSEMMPVLIPLISTLALTWYALQGPDRNDGDDIDEAEQFILDCFPMQVCVVYT